MKTAKRKMVLIVLILINIFALQYTPKQSFKQLFLHKETLMVRVWETTHKSLFGCDCTPTSVSAYIKFSIMQYENENVLTTKFYGSNTQLKELKNKLEDLQQKLDVLFALADLDGLIQHQNFLIHHFVHQPGDTDWDKDFIEETHFMSNHVVNCLAALNETYKNLDA